MALPILISLWVIGLVLCALSTVVLRIKFPEIEKRRVCARCGYPRVGLPSTQVCPECGTPQMARPAAYERESISKRSAVMVSLGAAALGTVVSVISIGLLFHSSGIASALFTAVFVAIGYLPLMLVLTIGLRRLPRNAFVICASLGSFASTVGTVALVAQSVAGPPDAQGGLVVLVVGFWSAPMCGYGMLLAAAIVLVREARSSCIAR